MTAADPMAKYFGPQELRKEYEEQIPTPIGQPCVLCDELIAEGDVGTINYLGQLTHHECMLRGVVGSVGHQLRQCHCFGGSLEDPPGLSPRQAATAALMLLNRREGGMVLADFYGGV